MLLLMYDGFSAIDADNDMDAREVEAIRALGQQFGVSQQEFQQIHNLYLEQKKFNEKQRSILVPMGGDNFFSGVNKFAWKWFIHTG